MDSQNSQTPETAQRAQNRENSQNGQTTPHNLQTAFEDGIRALQEPVACWKYMRARKRFHQVALSVSDDAGPRCVRLCWTDLKKSVSKSRNPKKSFDVLVFGHNYQKLPFGLDVERAAQKLPFQCGPAQIFVLYSEEAPWTCLILAFEDPGIFETALRGITQMVQSERERDLQSQGAG